MKEKQPKSQGAAAPQIVTPDWNAFLRILAPQFITRDTDILISKKDNTISFEIATARLKEFQDHFGRVLQSSESLDLQLSYQYNKDRTAISSKSLPIEAEIFEGPHIENLEQAKSFMAKLFGLGTMDGDSNFPVKFNNLFVKYEKGVLISDPDSLLSADMVKRGLAFLCAHFNAVNVQTLRRIISQPDPDLHLQAPGNAIVTAKEGEGFVQTCFGFIEDTSQIYFNIGRFLQLIYPPQVYVDEITEVKARVTISASYLLLYVKQLSRHGILFTVEVKHGKVSAQPLVLPHKETIQKPLTVFIVLDDSGSMEKYRDKLFENVRLLIGKIALVAPKADICLTIFSGKNQQKSYNGKAENFDFDCFNQVSLRGLTALYDAISGPLKQMKNILDKNNTMLIVFTDGQNNDSAVQERDISKQINDIRQAVGKGGMPPEIYAIGYGEELDTNVLNGLARAAFHHEYTKLESFESLGAIMHGIEGFEHGRVVAEFRTVIGGVEETHTVPICLDEQPHVVRQVTFPLYNQPVRLSFMALTKGEELGVNQATLQITPIYAQRLMEGYGERVEKIYNESWAPAKKIAELNGVLSEMNTFCARAPQQVVLALQTDLQDKINGYKEELVKNHDAPRSSAESSAPRASSPSLGRDSPINAGIINSSPRVEERKVSSPTPR